MDGKDQAAADAHYFESLLPAILPIIRFRAHDLPTYSGLISLLGFTPETAVISYLLLKPKNFVVLHTPETAKFLNKPETFLRL